MDVLAYGTATVLNVAIVSFIVRRLLGVPVGWPRTILVGLLVNGASSGLLTWMSTTMRLDVTRPSEALVPTAAILTLGLAWIIGAQVAILAMLEAFVPTGSLPGPVAFLRSLPARRRRAARYTSIVRIAAAHGLGIYLRPTPRSQPAPASKVAHSLRGALTEGGVTFVKLGQMISSRPDLVPDAYIRELSQLQSHVPAQPWAHVSEVLEADLGRPAAEVFADIDEEPVAAASLAQVHLARLRSGEEVVVKIQRAGARAQTMADLDIILRLAHWLDRATGWGRRLGVRALADGFADSLREELDYRVELDNMRAVGVALERAGRDRVRVPRAHADLSSARVLVLDRMPGRPVSESAAVLDRFPAEERRQMAGDLLGTVLHQVVVSGVFHADLHPGNIFVADDGRLGLLDFGAVGRLDGGARSAIGMLLGAVDRQDSLVATDALLDLLDRGEALDDRRLERDLGQLILRHAAIPSGPSGAGSAALFVDLFRLVMDHGLAVPAQVAAAFRALGSLEGSLRLISPGMDLVSAARDEGRGLVTEQLSVPEARQRIEGQLAALLPMLQRLPRRVGKLAEDLEAGRLTMSVRAFRDPQDRAFITGIVHQLVLTALAAACTLGGVLLLMGEGGPMMTEAVRLNAFLGFVLLFFGFVLGSRVLVLVFHQHRATQALEGQR